jgi:threonine/homoserine/homoserine lactone efflux protein
MTMLASLFAILGAVLIGAISPGPSFVMVARTSIALSRRAGFAAALGMGLGGAIFAALAVGGLYALLMKITWLYLGLKVAGGAYLVYLATRIWRGAAGVLVVEGLALAPVRLRTSLGLGLTTQLSNPKTALVYASIFAALLPRHVPAWACVVLPPLVFAVEAGWYSVVAFSFSARRPQAFYLKLKSSVDRTAAGVIGALGLKLIFDALRRA